MLWLSFFSCKVIFTPNCIKLQCFFFLKAQPATFNFKFSVKERSLVKKLKVRRHQGWDGWNSPLSSVFSSFLVICDLSIHGKERMLKIGKKMLRWLKQNQLVTKMIDQLKERSKHPTIHVDWNRTLFSQFSFYFYIFPFFSRLNVDQVGEKKYITTKMYRFSPWQASSLQAIHKMLFLLWSAFLLRTRMFQKYY